MNRWNCLERNFVGVRVGCSPFAMSVLTQNVFGTIQAITKKGGHFSASRPNSRGQRIPQPVEQVASGLSCDDQARVAAKAVIIAEVERLHWRLWNGNAANARISIDRIAVIFICLTGTPRIVRNRRQSSDGRSLPKARWRDPPKTRATPALMGPGPVCQRSYGSPCRHALSLRPPTDTRRREES